MGLFSGVEQATKALGMCSGIAVLLRAFVDAVRVDGETSITEVWETFPLSDTSHRASNHER